MTEMLLQALTEAVSGEQAGRKALEASQRVMGDGGQGAALIHASTPASTWGGQLAQAGTTVIFKSLGKKTIINNSVCDSQ